MLLAEALNLQITTSWIYTEQANQECKTFSGILTKPITERKHTRGMWSFAILSIPCWRVFSLGVETWDISQFLKVPWTGRAHSHLHRAVKKNIFSRDLTQRKSNGFMTVKYEWDEQNTKYIFLLNMCQYLFTPSN